MTEGHVRVVVHRDGDDCLAFDLIFEDGSYKPYKLDTYQVRQYRGLNARQVIEATAADYYDSINEPRSIIYLTFI